MVIKCWKVILTKLYNNYYISSIECNIFSDTNQLVYKTLYNYTTFYPSNVT